MFTNIAWATDGSGSAWDALPLAEKLARDSGGRLAVVHVQEIMISLAGVLTEDNEAVLSELRSTVQRLRDSGIDAVLMTAKATARDVPRRLLELAEIAGADVVVVGNRGQGTLSHFLVGSVSAGLQRIASMPVVVAPHESAVPARPAAAVQA